MKFIIGGPYGLNDKNLTLKIMKKCLSKMTFFSSNDKNFCFRADSTEV